MQIKCSFPVSDASQYSQPSTYSYAFLECRLHEMARFLRSWNILDASDVGKSRRPHASLRIGRPQPNSGDGGEFLGISEKCKLARTSWAFSG